MQHLQARIVLVHQIFFKMQSKLTAKILILSHNPITSKDNLVK
uniref:Uncharacterized protein n=1 Tax=Arundo donax TaxID=35708 RepID=A0A0A9B1T2_ARUDO